MDYRNMFNRDYIGAWDLTKEATVTITRVEAKELKNGKGSDKKPIVYMQGKEKGWVLNKTNAKVLARLYGNDTKQWIGKQITLFASKTDVGGETVDCIRCKPPRPGAVSETAAEPAREPGEEG